MDQQDSQHQQDSVASVPQESKFWTTVNKVTGFIRVTMITIIVLGVVGGGLALGFVYLTSDRTLAGSVSYHYLDDGQGYVLTVANEFSDAWENPTVIVNDKFKFRSEALRGNTTYNFDLTQFVTDNGERFRPESMVPVKVKVESGWSSGEWSFK